MQLHDPIDAALEQRLRNYYEKQHGLPPDPEQVLAHLTPEALAQRQYAAGLAVKSSTARNRKVAFEPRRAKPVRPIRVGIIAAVACIFILAGTAFASHWPIMDELLQAITAGSAQVHYTDTNQSQSIDGYTFTLHKVSADANRVQMGFDIQAPPHTSGLSMMQEFLAFGHMTLKTEQNVILPSLNGIARIPVKTQSGLAFGFDASGIQGNPDKVSLTLTIQCLKNRSITFTATVPFHAGRVLNPNQSVTVDGKTMSLDRIVITPSAARMYVKGLVQPGPGVIVTSLSTHKTYRYSVAQRLKQENTWIVDFDPTLFAQSGSWQLTLVESYQVHGEIWNLKFTV